MGISLWWGNRIKWPYGSITAIRHHRILFSLMINYATGVLHIASESGVGSVAESDIFTDLTRTTMKRTKHLLDALTPISFQTDPAGTRDRGTTFVTFSDGKKYDDNLVESKVFGQKTIDQSQEHLVYDVTALRDSNQLFSHADYCLRD